MVATACVHQLFEAQVRRTPDAVALVDASRSYSYRDVETRSNRLAWTLIDLGITTGHNVGIACDRSCDMVIALLGVLKSGAAYVPVQSRQPPRRIDHILRDASISVVVTSGPRTSIGATDTPTPTVVDLLNLRSVRDDSPRRPVAGDDALFVLYTSGSTGEPKGVLSCHSTIVNRLHWAQHKYPYAAGEVACARTSLGFVDSVAEIFAPLAFGVPLVMLGEDAQRDTALMLAVLARHRVTRIVMVPSLLTTLLELYPDLGQTLPTLRYWFVGGEPVPVPLVAAFKGALPGRKLINIYGATELSGDATYFDFDRMPHGLENSPIGMPIHGVYARIVDSRLREVPDSEVGEVCISGACLARGYLNRPTETTARFVPNPFPEGGRLYKTGDMARRLATGHIEYLGRRDHQVKIRGTRIELGDVESNMAAYPGISQAIAVVHQDSRQRNVLVGFYTTIARSHVAADGLRDHMAAQATPAAVPTHLVLLAELPLNSNGKTDRHALKRWDIEAMYECVGGAPIGDDELAVATIWARMLGRRTIPRHRRFHELGGNSLTAIRIAAAVTTELRIRLPVSAVFAHPTVAQFAAHVTAARADAAPQDSVAPLTPSSRVLPPTLPLSHHQFPFWFFRALTGDVSVVSAVFAFSDRVDIQRLQRAYAETVCAFDVLWMKFPRWTPVQRITKRSEHRFAVGDRRSSREDEADILQGEADRNNTVPFDLNAPPHVHARLVLLASGDTRLLVCIPHVAADMMAMDIFRRTLQSHYARHASAPQHAPVATEPATLLDLVEWERRDATTAMRTRDQEFWRGRSRGSAQVQLPARLFTHKLAGTRATAFCGRHVSDKLATQLHANGKHNGITMPMFMASSLCAALGRAGEIDNVTILVALENRDHDAVRNLFTTMASLMPLQVTGARTLPLDMLVNRVKQLLLAAYDHTGFMMRQPTLFNDFWRDEPALTRWLLGRASSLLARCWPRALVDHDAVAHCIRAAAHPPTNVVAHAARRVVGAPPAVRPVLVVLNILPEVYQSPTTADEPLKIAHKRGMELLLKPSDRAVNSDPALDQTLQVHVSRDDRQQTMINLYGGGLDAAGLEYVGDRMLHVLTELADTTLTAAIDR